MGGGSGIENWVPHGSHYVCLTIYYFQQKFQLDILRNFSWFTFRIKVITFPVRQIDGICSFVFI